MKASEDAMDETNENGIIPEPTESSAAEDVKLDLTSDASVTATNELRDLAPRSDRPFPLSYEEQAAGFTRPLRFHILHVKCGAVSEISQREAFNLARNPLFYSEMECLICVAAFPVNQFKWEDGAVVGS